MSTDIGEPISVINPATGEALTLASPTEDLGRWLADVREYEALLREAKNLVQGELLARMDKRGKWTTHAAGFELRGSSPKPTEEFDAGALRDDLLELVDADVLDIEAVDAAVEQVIELKVHKSGINALRAIGGDVKDTVDRHGHQVPKARYISVNRA